MRVDADGRGSIDGAPSLGPAATLTLDQIVQLCDDLIEAHGDALPAGIRKP